MYGFKVGGDSQSQKDFLPTPIIKYQLDNSVIKTSELCNGNQPKGEHEVSFPLTSCMRKNIFLPRGHLGIENRKKENQPLQGVELWVIFLTKKRNLRYI